MSCNKHVPSLAKVTLSGTECQVFGDLASVHPNCLQQVCNFPSEARETPPHESLSQSRPKSCTLSVLCHCLAYTSGAHVSPAPHDIIFEAATKQVPMNRRLSQARSRLRLSLEMGVHQRLF